MDTLGEVNLEALEARAKLQVKVHRTILRHQLIMIGNVLLVAFLFAALILLVWTVMLLLGATEAMFGVYAPLLGTSARRLLQMSIVGMAGFKLASLMLLLCPGLAFRICGNAMEV
ncbi:MAG: hypothetical protein KKI08_18150 [Armatimonadetes bacterium]|nr:hypothetical protein [Armatimonadota bacterium]